MNSPDQEPGMESAMGETMAMARERGPFAGLLVAQLFFIGSTPFVGDTGIGRIFLYSGVFGIMGAGVYVSAASRKLLIISSVFILIAIGAWMGPDILPDKFDSFLRVTITGFGYAFTAGIVLVKVAGHERVTTDTILGGISAYLLIACAFMMLHGTVMVITPDAYMIGGRSLHDEIAGAADTHGLATLLYFSFTTLTTLGYGDIVPVGPFARLLTGFEAIVGQLYVAIFIARLVSLEVSQRGINNKS